MALRLTEPLASPTTIAPQLTLPARAAARLRERDVPGFRAVCDEADTAGGLYQRQQSRRQVLDAALSTEVDGPRALAANLLAVAERAVTWLEEDPREPVMLNLAGVALYELGGLKGAEVLLAAAGRLDPLLPNVKANLAHIARRRRAGIDIVRKLPPVIATGVRALETRAKRCALRAQPAQGLTLSLCMIVKDEEAMLGRCLSAMRDYVDEIVVVDTGSSDRTVEIAESFGARVLHHEWTGSFAEARNVSFEAATGDWVMYLDADEILVDGEGERLRELTGRVWREAFYLIETNHTGEADDGTAVTHNALRVFRNRPWLRFDGRIHEQIAHNLPGQMPDKLEVTSVRVEHFGYLSAVRDAKEKSRRNIELLERQVAEGLDTPFLSFNLGSELAAVGDNARALPHFRKGWAGTRDDPQMRTYGYAPALAGRLVRSLRLNERHHEVVAVGDEVLEVFPGFTDVVYEQALSARAAGDEARAEQLLERCLQMGDAPSEYSSAVGAGTYYAMTALAMLRRSQGRIEDAEEILRRCLSEYPRFLGCVDPLATAMLARGASPADVVEVVHATVDEVTPSVRFMLAIALYEAGAVVEAEQELLALLERQPQNDLARVALAEALLSQARYAEAATAAGEVDPDAPAAPSAVRSELFGTLAAGDAPAARAALGRPPAEALHPAERAVFAGWLALCEGGPGPEVLPAEAGGVLAVVLEALLRVQDIDGFAGLVGLMDAVDVPWRERRELLAGIYLRRGFLESAADEWIAVCQSEQPDGDALAGLASVALARGLGDDARLFATEAQVLSPGHPGAARVLERLAAAA